MEILKYLNNSSVVECYKIIDYRRWESGQYLNLRIYFIDKSILFVKEYQEKEEKNYSYHWQGYKENLIIRWDNASLS